MRKNVLFIFLIILFQPACNIAVKEEKKTAANSEHMPEFAKRFSFDTLKSYRVIHFHNPWNPSEIQKKIVCVPKNQKMEPMGQQYTIIRTPIEKIVTMSGTQIAAISKLQKMGSIAGVDSKAYIINSQLKARLARNEVKQVGRNGRFMIEKLMAMQPDAILISPFKNSSHEKLRELGLTVLPYADYLEEHPLGRAEWLKVLGILYGKEEQAVNMFQAITERYFSLKEKVATVTSRPTVFASKPYGGVWYMPGGESYMAHFFEDAGARYLWNNNANSGSLSLDFETVYAKAANADFWRLVVSSDEPYTYNKLKNEDKRFADFRAFRRKKVLVCNIKNTPYYERGALEPDNILADFVKAFHPALMPDYQPTYFKIMQTP